MQFRLMQAMGRDFGIGPAQEPARAIEALCRLAEQIDIPAKSLPGVIGDLTEMKADGLIWGSEIATKAFSNLLNTLIEDNKQAKASA